jgi:hypothetical protein
MAQVSRCVATPRIAAISKGLVHLIITIVGSDQKNDFDPDVCLAVQPDPCGMSSFRIGDHPFPIRTTCFQ